MKCIILAAVAATLIFAASASAASVGPTPTVGTVLTAPQAVFSGTLTPMSSVNYSWDDCNAAGHACAAISGATASTYMVASADVGHSLESQEYAASAFVSGTPVTSGMVGEMFTAPSSVFSGTLTPMTGGAVYGWRDCTSTCTAIAGATASTYTLASTDVGFKVKAVETNNSGYTPVVTSGAVTYTGPTAISGVTNLTATTIQPNIVAVTWKLDGTPVATSSVAPYSFDFNSALASPGAHTMTVEAVNQDGVRTQSPGVPVTVGSGPAGQLAAGTYPGMTLSSGQLVYGSGPSTIVNGNVTMASGSRLENLTVDGTITASNTTGARVQDVTINPPASASVALTLDSSNGFDLEDSTIACGQASGDIKGVYNGNFDGSSNNAIFARDTITNCGGDGIWMVTPAVDNTTALVDILALDNQISGANGPVDNGTQARGMLIGGYEGNVIGNTVTGGSTASIEPFRSAQYMHFAYNTVSGSPTGFYLEHFSDHSIFENNTVSASSHGFNVEWVASSSPPRSTVDATIKDNTITAPTGVFADAGSMGIETEGNMIIGALPAVVYEGSTDGDISNNVACTSSSGAFASVYANDGYDPTGNVTQSNNLIKSASCS